MDTTTAVLCKDGLIIKAVPTTTGAILLYLGALLYCFLGIAIAADVFMCAIEVITSATKDVKVKRTKKNQLVLEEALSPDEETQKVRIWNPTVANLTLMALGSSAPEILLSCIEIVGNRFYAGDLGPGTIVGSAAFNLLCITAICVIAIPSPKTKKIDQTAVFAITSVFSCFAYIWLLIILSVISPNVVELWEAALTFFFFGILVVVSYMGDIKIWKKKTADLEVELKEIADEKTSPEVAINANVDQCIQNFIIKLTDGARVASPPVPGIHLIKELAQRIQKTHPEFTIQQVAQLLAFKLKKLQPHTRLYYRIKGSKILAASHRKTETELAIEQMLEETRKIEQVDKRKVIRGKAIEFSARVYGIGKDQANVQLTVVRHGPLDKPLTFHYSTVNGTAKKNLHFYAKSEWARFAPYEEEKNITIELVEDADWRQNTMFYVHLRLDPHTEEEEKTNLGRTYIARVCRPFDQQSFIGEPMVEFSEANYVVRESEKFVRAFVTRRGHHDRNDFTISYETNGVTAQSDVDFVAVTNGVLKFAGSEYEKYIDIRIIDDEEEEKDETFEINITAVHGEVTIGPKKRTVITIICDDSVLKNILNIRKLTSYYVTRMSFGARTWLEQIACACSVNEGDVANATLRDCFLHALSFPWKFAFSFVPPPTFLGGWPCFFVGLILIGLVTAIVGDLASIFGCMVGLKDTITAITFVALGTSLPDTFASKIAAQNDDNADNAIGNVTGSNSVNVFLGLGLPWLIAATYWYSKGENFVVNAGSLGFSVAVFMITSLLCLSLLVARRQLAFFGKAELGGPTYPKLMSTLFLFGLWLIYVAMSTLQTYGIINV